MGPTLSLYIYKIWEEQILAAERFFLFFIFIFFASLFDVRSFDRWNSLGQEQKFIYSMRATCEYQKHRISLRIQIRSSENPKFRYFLRSTAF